MLSRTADNLFWMGRYVERAENISRLLHVTHHMSLMAPEGIDKQLWLSALEIAGVAESYAALGETPSAASVVRFLALDPNNRSSIFASLRQARENARGLRPVITTDSWEALNDTWLEIKEISYARLLEIGFTEFFDWVKNRSHQIRGATVGTMLRDDAFKFLRLGTFLERADNTARLLDVKYHILQSNPHPTEIGGAADYYQWDAVLQAVSARKAYRRIYRNEITPSRVASLVILRPDMPRSLRGCYEEVHALTQSIFPGAECTRQAGEMRAQLEYARIETILEGGLHEFLTEVVSRIAKLGFEIEKQIGVV